MLAKAGISPEKKRRFPLGGGNDNESNDVEKK